MAKTTFYDSYGYSLETMEKDGYLFPAVSKYTLSAGNLSARRDDIFLCGYPRSGTNWSWEILMMLVHNDSRMLTVGKMDSMLEFMGCDYLDKQKSPRVMNTHLSYDRLPPDMVRQQSKIVLVVRNPKDVAVSYYNFLTSIERTGYKGPFAGFLELHERGQMHYGSWFAYVKEWDEVLKSGCPCPVYILYYEQLKKNFKPTVKKLAAFLDLSRPDEFYDEVERVTSFGCFKEAKTKYLKNESLEEAGESPEFLRKGVVGDWKNWFTVAQNEHFNKLIDEELSGCSFQFDYE